MPSGLPDWTVPTAIVAQLIDKLAVDIAAQSIGSIKVDIAAQSVAELDVHVTNASLDVNIVGSSITLDVNVTNSRIYVEVMGTTDIRIVGQNVGVYIQQEWSEVEGSGKTLFGSALSVDPDTEAVLISYTVPSGKTLYITGVSVAVVGDGGVVAELFVGSDVVWALGGRCGAASSFNKPIKALAGEQVVLKAIHYAPSSAALFGSVIGYEK